MKKQLCVFLSVLIAVNPEDFAAFRNLSVTFSYGVFE